MVNLYNIIIFLFGINLLLKGPYLLIAPVLMMAFRGKKLYFNFDMGILILFSLCYFTISGIVNGEMPLVVWCIPIAYYVGYNYSKKITFDTLQKVYLLLAGSMALHGMLNLLYEFVINGGFIYGGVHYDFWSRQVSSVTGQMTNYSLLATLVGYYVFFARKKIWLALGLVISIVHTIITGGRSYLFLLLLSFCVSWLIYACNEKRRKSKKILSTVMFLLLLFGAVFVSYKYDFLGIREMMNSSYLYERLYSDYAVANDKTIFTTSRWELKHQYIMLMDDYLFGGEHMKELVGYYSHDFMLDIYDSVGIFPFVLMLIYLMRMILRMKKKVFRDEIPVVYKVIYGSFLVTVFAQFFVEPILSSAPVFLLSVVLIDGMISRVNIKSVVEGD